MAVSYEVGDKVKVTVNDMPYAGVVVTYDSNTDPVEYKISAVGIGDIIIATDDDIEALDA